MHMVVVVLCFKAAIGVCNTEKPGTFDVVGQAKWNAWNQLGDLSQVCLNTERLGSIILCCTCGVCCRKKLQSNTPSMFQSW